MNYAHGYTASLVLEVTTDNDAGMSHHAELVHGSGVAAKELAAIADAPGSRVGQLARSGRRMMMPTFPPSPVIRQNVARTGKV